MINYQDLVTVSVKILNLDTEMSIDENLDKIVEFITNIVVMLGEFEISISSTDIDDK